MVAVVAIEVDDVKRQAGVLGEGLKELAEKLGIEVADLRAREVDLPDEVGPAGNVQSGARAGLVHREVDGGIARDTAAVAERLADRLAEGDTDILGGVVQVDMRVARRPDRQINKRMTGKLLQH